MMEAFQPVFTNSYDPLKAGSIDGTDEYPHDKAIFRALGATFKPNKFVQGKSECTIFVGRLGPNTTEDSIIYNMKEFGKIVNVRLVKDVVTGFSKCYGFLEYEEPYQARNAVRNAHKMMIDEHEVLVEMEKGWSLKGWIPRRLGGGLGGKRESGQLRFGGKDRPFRRPILRPDLDKNRTVNVNVAESGDKIRRRSRSRERRRSKSRERRGSRSKDRYREKGWNRYRDRDYKNEKS